jgi:hypothetical protein
MLFFFFLFLISLGSIHHSAVIIHYSLVLLTPTESAVEAESGVAVV